MRKLHEVRELITDSEFTTKVYMYFSTKTAGDDFDPYEANYTFSELNPKVIKGYVRDVSPEALIFKQYGLHNIGAIEIITESKYENWFENCERVVVNSVDYQVFRQAPGSRALIQKRPYNLLRVILQRKD